MLAQLKSLLFEFIARRCLHNLRGVANKGQPAKRLTAEMRIAGSIAGRRKTSDIRRMRQTRCIRGWIVGSEREMRNDEERRYRLERFSYERLFP